MDNKQYFFSAFGTFGTPNGFQQSFFLVNNPLVEKLTKKIKTFDLKTNAIKLFPHSKVYSIRKEFLDNQNILTYSAYKFAKEQNSTRGGTFVGSSLIFLNKISDENIIIRTLNEFNDNLYDRNVANEIISVSHSEEYKVNSPKDFDKIDINLKDIDDLNFIKSSNKSLVVYTKTKPEVLQEFYEKSIILLNVYDSIFFTENHEVAEYVNQRELFKLVEKDGFNQEIEDFYERRRKQVESSISKFKLEIQKLEKDKSLTLNDFRGQINKNEKQHQENEKKITASKNNIDQVEQIYKDFSEKISDLCNQLKAGRKLEDIKQIYNKNKRLFIDAVGNIERPTFINSVSIPKPRTHIAVKSEELFIDENDVPKERNRRHQNKTRINIYKVATYFLSLLLIGIIIYHFTFSNDESKDKTNTTQQTIKTHIINKEQGKIKTSAPDESLSPIPNSELNINDYTLVAKKIKFNTRIDSVIEVIIKNNPTDVGQYYKNQKKRYAQYLRKKNPDCFTKKGNFYFIKDTIKHIPSHKSNQ